MLLSWLLSDFSLLRLLYGKLQQERIQIYSVNFLINTSWGGRCLHAKEPSHCPQLDLTTWAQQELNNTHGVLHWTDWVHSSATYTLSELLKTVKSVLKFPGKLQYTAVMLGCIAIFNSGVQDWVTATGGFSLLLKHDYHSFPYQRTSSFYFDN